MGVDDALRHAGRQPEGAARRGLRRRLRRERRAQGEGARYPGPLRCTEAGPHRDRVAGESLHFGHVETVGQRVLIIGVGNTAMDCCRSAKRLGATDVKVIARKRAQVLQGVAVGARGRRGRAGRDRREPVAAGASSSRTACWSGWSSSGSSGPSTTRGSSAAAVVETIVLPCDARDSGDRAGQRLSLDRARHRPRVRQLGHAGGRQGHDQCRAPGVFFGGDAALGPANIIWAVEHGHQAAISIHLHCQGAPIERSPAAGDDARQHQDGDARVGYRTTTMPAKRQKMQHVELPSASAAWRSRSSSASPRSRPRPRWSAA